MNILLGKVYEEDDNDGGVDEGNAAAKNNGNDDELKVTASHLSPGWH